MKSETALAQADATPDGLDVAPLALAKAGSGKPEATCDNVALVLNAPQIRDAIRFEEFSQRTLVTGLMGLGYFPDGEWGEAHTTQLVQLCERNGLNVSFATVDRAVALQAQKNSYNVLSDFAWGCADQWDGVARVDRAFTTYWRAEDTAATRAASRVFFLSLLRRAFEPGSKVDTCTVFVGKQGARKSTALEAVVGKAWFADSPLPIGEKDGMQALPGIWLWEFQENESLSRRDAEAIKAFLSQKTDRYRPSYGRHMVTVPRQTCFASTSNSMQTLKDPTGARRMLPVVVGAVDVEGIERDQIQLLGEAARRVCNDERHWPTDAESTALDIIRDAHRAPDPWEAPIAAWLGDSPNLRTGFTLDEVFETETHSNKSKVAGPVPIPVERRTKADQNRAASILRDLHKYERRREWSEPHRGDWLWHAPGR